MFIAGGTNHIDAEIDRLVKQVNVTLPIKKCSNAEIGTL